MIAAGFRAGSEELGVRFFLKTEVFSQAKDPEDQEANEDRILVLPNRAYAVIDGVTDKSGRQYDGLTGGRIAGRLVEDAIRDACADREPDTIDVEWLLGRIGEKFATAFWQMGIHCHTDSFETAQFAAQLALALMGREGVRFIIIGDCGLRLNGKEVLQPSFSLDVIGAVIRKVVWNHLKKNGADRQSANDLARAYTVTGLQNVLPNSGDLITSHDLVGIREEVLAEASKALPQISQAHIAEAFAGGMSEQHRYANRVHPLGFATINGRPVPRSMIVSIDRKLSEIDTIELFSDGYFGVPEGTEIEDWEDWIARVEAEDPEKLGRFSSTKGSVGRCMADDRTILIIRNQKERSVSTFQALNAGQKDGERLEY